MVSHVESLSPPREVGTAPAPVPTANGGDNAAQVMSQFQQLMHRFLDTQQSVMLAYLRSRANGDGAGIGNVERKSQAAPPARSPALPPALAEAPRRLAPGEPIGVGAPPTAVEFTCCTRAPLR